MTGTIYDAPPSSGLKLVTVVLAGSHTYTFTSATPPSATPSSPGEVTVNGTAWSVTVPTPLDEEIYDVKVTVLDNAGNSGQDTTTAELVVDQHGPIVSADVLGATNNNKPTLTGKVADAISGLSGNVTVAVINHATGATIQTLTAPVTFTAWSTAMPGVPVAGTWSVAVPVRLGDGTYDIKATAMDIALNTGTGTTSQAAHGGHVEPDRDRGPPGDQRHHAHLVRDGERQ